MENKSYFDKCWRHFITMPVGEKLELETMVSPENRNEFKAAVEFFIDRDYGRDKGNFYIEPNSDFTYIRKFNY